MNKELKKYEEEKETEVWAYLVETGETVSYDMAHPIDLPMKYITPQELEEKWIYLGMGHIVGSDIYGKLWTSSEMDNFWRRK